jgi:hypothetical protein
MWTLRGSETDFMAVDRNPDYILPPPMVNKEKTVEYYSIVVFHQLHCLVSLGLRTPDYCSETSDTP